MRPGQAIAMLDRQLAAHGETIRLSRPGGSPAECDCPAFVRGYKPIELIGAITQKDRKVVLSPSGLAAGSWPIPEDGDRIRIAGVWMRVMAAEALRLAGAVVRIELQVRGE